MSAAKRKRADSLLPSTASADAAALEDSAVQASDSIRALREMRVIVADLWEMVREGRVTKHDTGDLDDAIYRLTYRISNLEADVASLGDNVTEVVARHQRHARGKRRGSGKAVQ